MDSLQSEFKGVVYYGSFGIQTIDIPLQAILLHLSSPIPRKQDYKCTGACVIGARLLVRDSVHGRGVWHFMGIFLTIILVCDYLRMARVRAKQHLEPDTCGDHADQANRSSNLLPLVGLVKIGFLSFCSS